MKKIVLLLLISIITLSQTINAEKLIETVLFESNDLSVEIPTLIISNIEYDINIRISDSIKNTIQASNPLLFTINDAEIKIIPKKGVFSFKYTYHKDTKLKISIQNFSFKDSSKPIPLWCSIVPPLIAILMALLIKEVLSALFAGIFSGTFIIYLYQDNSVFEAIGKAIFAIPDTYIIRSMADTGHISIIIFSMLIGAMVALITKNGGMQGVVDKLAPFAKDSRSGQLITWLLGILIFFDDYANTLVVGNTMQPITDRLKISREKLAYIVDSTAAPVASIAMITTWIGIELSYIESATIQIGIQESAYSIFLNSLSYRFYPILTLIFILLLVWFKKDFGPMLKAEKNFKKKFKENNIETTIEDNKIKARWYNAALPVFVIVFGTFFGLLYTGWSSEVWNNDSIEFSSKLSLTVGASDSYLALLWSSISAVLLAVGLTLAQKIMTLGEATETLLDGFKTMLTAVVILILAWAIADITKDLRTADFISNILISSNVSPIFLPALTFILSAIIAFSTGSSWGTMAILYPLILPSTWSLCHSVGMNDLESMNIFYVSVSAILSGSVLGDHCSPISDTTILSSLACSCNHLDHVKTQMPYALTVGLVSIVCGLIPAAMGISPLIIFPFSILILFLIIKYIGKNTETV